MAAPSRSATGTVEDCEQLPARIKITQELEGGAKRMWKPCAVTAKP